VRYLERVGSAPALRVFALEVDLGRAELSLHATRRADRGRTVSSFAGRYGVQVAINGDFFKGDFTTEGLAMGAGALWTGSSDGPRWSFLAAGCASRVEIPLPELSVSPEPWMSDIVGGFPLLVDEGVALDFPDCTTSFCRRNPRTAVGLSEDGRRLILAVIDGRTTRSVGMSLPEEAALMVELGAWRALNLDGGGSSAMFVEAEGGVVNAPSDGSERKVGNHLGLAVAPASDAGPPDAASDPAPGPDAAAPPAPTPDAGAALVDPEIGGGCGVGGVRTRDGGALLAGLLVVAWLLARRRMT
jgi:hypothetical protein